MGQCPHCCLLVPIRLNPRHAPALAHHPVAQPGQDAEDPPGVHVGDDPPVAGDDVGDPLPGLLQQRVGALHLGGGLVVVDAPPQQVHLGLLHHGVAAVARAGAHAGGQYLGEEGTIYDSPAAHRAVTARLSTESTVQVSSLPH